MSSVSIRVVWSDIDVIRVEVVVSSVAFTGRTVVYTTEELLRAAAEKIIGFPRASTDVAAFRLATTQYERASFELKCIDGAGHAVLIAEIENHSGLLVEKATIVVPVFPSLLDEFGKSLNLMAQRSTNIAVLDD
jgi:hypothetical protein